MTAENVVNGPNSHILYIDTRYVHFFMATVSF